MAAVLRKCSRISSLFALRNKLSFPEKNVQPRFLIPVRLYSDKIVDPPYLGPPVPNYKHREDETLEMKKSRLLYQSRKRGMLENGLLLSTFASKHLENLNEDSLEMYDKIINQPSNDWDLYYWMTGNKPTPEEYYNTVMDMLKEHARNKQRDVRLQQPDLKQNERQ